MSYSISIAGSKTFDAAEEAVSFEQEVVQKVRDFVDALDGVTHAQVIGGQTGTTDLTPTTEPLAEAEPAAPAEPAQPGAQPQPLAPPAEPTPGT